MLGCEKTKETENKRHAEDKDVIDTIEENRKICFKHYNMISVYIQSSARKEIKTVFYGCGRK